MRLAHVAIALSLAHAACSDPDAEAIKAAETSDEAYCKLFAKRIQECMPTTREGRTLDQETTRCRDGRATARAMGTWNDQERRTLVGCLAKRSCDDVTACMRTP